MKSYQTAAGYAVPNGTTASYYYQVKDWQGSQHITLDASGVIKNAMDYYPYGKMMPARNTFATNQEGYRYQFTDHEKDGETSYQYHGARYYDEDLARYMSVDPWADKYANWSTYNYAMSNPLTFIDPTGKGVEYTDDVAKGMAARGKENGYITRVVANPNKEGDYGVFFQKRTGGRLYRGVQFDGKFEGIGKGGLVSKKQEQKEINAFASAAVNNTFGPPKASGACNACGIADPIIAEGQEKLSDGLQWLGMGEDAANYTSAGVFIIGSVVLSQKLGAMRTPKTGVSKLASSWQGEGAYPGVDVWKDITLAEGKEIVGGLPGQSNFYTTLSALKRSSLDRNSLFEGLQVQKHPQYGYRGEVGVYRVTESTPAAFGTTYANTQFGAGGLPQVFVPDYSGLQLIKTIPLK